MYIEVPLSKITAFSRVSRRVVFHKIGPAIAGLAGPPATALQCNNYRAQASVIHAFLGTLQNTGK